MVTQCQVSPSQFRHFRHHASSSSDTFLPQISDIFFHHFQSPEVRCLRHSSDNSLDHIWSLSEKWLCIVPLLLHYALSPTKKKFPPKSRHFFITLDLQLTDYSDTAATLSSPRLSTSDECLHRCSDTFFTPLILLVTNFPITVPTFFSPTRGMLLVNIYITNLVL